MKPSISSNHSFFFSELYVAWKQLEKVISHGVGHSAYLNMQTDHYCTVLSRCITWPSVLRNWSEQSIHYSMVSDDVGSPSLEYCTGVSKGWIGRISVSILTTAVFVYSVLHQESLKQSVGHIGPSQTSTCHLRFFYQGLWTPTTWFARGPATKKSFQRSPC